MTCDGKTALCTVVHRTVNIKLQILTNSFTISHAYAYPNTKQTAYNDTLTIQFADKPVWDSIRQHLKYSY